MKKNQSTTTFNRNESYLSGVIPFKLIACLVILMIVSSAQVLLGQSVKEMGALIAEMKQSDEAQAMRLKSLSCDLNPTVYLDNHGIKVFGENPVCAVVTGGAVNKLYEENPLFRQIELIKIKIDNLSDLSGSINLSSLSGFPNLKYIQILCEVNCTASQIDTMLSGSKANVVVCYLVSLPG